MKNNRTTWLLGMLVVSGCFRTTPCTSDAECGGAGGVCDRALTFCVTPPRADAGAAGGGAASGGGGGAAVGGGGGALGGGGGALGGGGGELDGGTDGGVDAGLDAGVAPTVLGVTPVGNTLEVLAAVRPTATFSEAMDSASLTRTTFTLAQGSLVIYVVIIGVYARYMQKLDKEYGVDEGDLE